MEWCAAVQRLTASNIPQLHGRTPKEYVEGSTPDISPYALFDWYQPVYYLNPSIDFPHEVKKIGRWIGVAEQCTDTMAYVILTGKGTTLVRKSVWAIPDTDLAHDAIKEKLNLFDARINAVYAVDWPSKTDTDFLDILNSSDDETTPPADSEDCGIKCHDYTS
jgi:hypothetical protein